MGGILSKLDWRVLIFFPLFFAPLLGILGKVVFPIYFVLVLLSSKGKLLSQASKTAKTIALMIAIYAFGIVAISLFHGVEIFTYSTMDKNLALFLALPVILFAPTKIAKLDISRFPKIAFVVLLITLIAGTISKIVLSNARPDLLAQNTITLCALVFIPTILALFAWHQKTPRLKLLSSLCLVIALLIVAALTQSRGMSLAYLGLSGLTIIYILYDSKRSTRANALRAGLVIGAIPLFAALTYLIFPDLGLFHRFENAYALVTSDNLTIHLNNTDYAASARLVMWEAALEAIHESPWIGYGLQNSYTAIEPYLNSPFNDSHVHNEYLHHMLTGGVFGLALWFLFAATPLIGFAFARNKHVDLFYLAFAFSAFVLMVGVTDRFLYHATRVPFIALFFVAYAALENIYAKQAETDMSTKA